MRLKRLAAGKEIMMNACLVLLCLCLVVAAVPGRAMGSKLVDALPIDNQCLVLHFQDAAVEYKWDDLTSGSQNGWDYYHTENWHLCNDKDEYIPFGEPLDTESATRSETFRITSADDASYAGGKAPVKIHRKSKCWEAAHNARKPAMHHWIYLELPSPLQRGKTYTLEIGDAAHTDRRQVTIVFDEFALESPAIKVSNLGYEASAVHKSADVYAWLGDGGGRDFARLDKTPLHLYDVANKRIAYSGNMRLHARAAVDQSFDKDFTGADVWACDFSEFAAPGQYRLVIEGVGASPAFSIGKNVFEAALKTAMQGMFYQRMGCDQKPAGGFPYSRRPLYKQGVEPEGFVVKISNREMVTGRNPDDMKWYAADATDRIVKESWGGWTDAYDNDQRPGNFICVFDILLTYYLTPGAFTDNQLYIPEQNNGVPDIIDEALWEIDWWLRMRDPQGGGYLTGLCNIVPPMKENYAGAACAWQGWCVAAGSAMAADCFRLAGLPELQAKYTKAALEAYAWAGQQTDTMLDTSHDGLRGRDLKMTAAAFLFNLTGEKAYEDVVLAETAIKRQNGKLRGDGVLQQYASVAYMASPQKVSRPELQADMIAAAIRQAREEHLKPMASSQTRAARAPMKWEGMCQTSNEVSMLAIAHRFTESAADRADIERGLYAEAEWTLGRNPLGLVQMTGLTDRCFTQTFAPGRRDGAPGLTPGWTPYMCRDGWMSGDDIHGCGFYTNRNYPADKNVWPFGEHFWNSRYSVPNSETTPQQTFRQKIVLYGYLYGVGRSRG